MAKLRKQPKSPSGSPISSKPKVRKIFSSGSSVLPVASQTLHDGTNHEQRRSDNAVRDKSQKREQTNISPPDWTKPNLPTSPWVRTEQPVVTKAQRRPSPLRISQGVAPVPEIVVAGPSQPEPAFRRGQCGPSCQKCGRPRKPRSPDESNDEITRTPAVNWPLPGPGNEPMPSTSEDAPGKGVEPEGPLPEPARSRRRKYFSLPSKPKPSFKGPMELASIKGKAVERPTYQEPSVEKVRPVSAPSPIKSPNLQPRGAPHVHFATDDHLGRFAANIRAPVATSSSHVQVPMPLTTGPAPKIHNQDHEKRVSKPPTRKPHPQPLKAAQPTLRPNSPVFYEWPLITTLVNQPSSNPNQRPPTVTNAPARSALSISKRPSRRNTRPYSNPHTHAPTPSRSTSHRRKSLLRQSRKVSYIVDHPATNSHDSISIQILDMLQGFPGGELAATAKTISERPSLLRLQIYPLDTAIQTMALSVGAPDEEIDGDVYSQSRDGSENDDDDDDDDDDLSMPSTPTESPLSPASFSAGDDKALVLRPASTTTHTSFSVGDDRIFNVRTYTNSELGLPSEPSTSDSERDVTAVSPPDPSPSREPASPQPLVLTPRPSPPAPVSRDSEGMIPVLRLSIDLPEVTPSGSENMDDDDDDDDDDDIDPDWLNWGALPGSYGGAGMWSESAGPVELEVPT